jgi:hypothetical protein
MASTQEVVIVSASDPLDATTTEISVQRANGEVWAFDVPGAPDPQVGAEAIFQSASMVFGDLAGFLIFPTLDNGRFAIADATRIR